MSSVATKAETATQTSALNTKKNKDGQVKSLHQIPRPATKEAERRWLLGQMAAAFRIFAKLGFADGSSGHISLRGAVDKGKDRSTILSPDGQQTLSSHIPSGSTLTLYTLLCLRSPIWFA